MEEGFSKNYKLFENNSLTTPSHLMDIIYHFSIFALIKTVDNGWISYLLTKD